MPFGAATQERGRPKEEEEIEEEKKKRKKVAPLTCRCEAPLRSTSTPPRPQRAMRQFRFPKSKPTVVIVVKLRASGGAEHSKHVKHKTRFKMSFKQHSLELLQEPLCEARQMTSRCSETNGKNRCTKRTRKRCEIRRRNRISKISMS